jgi:ribosomal protein S18 acetylase RimI-like enzyme
MQYMKYTKHILDKDQNNYHILYKLTFDNNIKLVEIGSLECEWLFVNKLSLRNNKEIFVDGSVFIKSLHVHPQFRLQGYGSQLLKNAINDANIHCIFSIELDDMSDHFAKNNNIYLKNGFKYVNPSDGPEMYLN